MLLRNCILESLLVCLGKILYNCKTYILFCEMFDAECFLIKIH
jgi:hypothetical protein